MNKLFRYLKQPYVTTDKPRHMVVVSALTIIFVLGIFQPFGFNQSSNKIWMLVGFGSVTALGTSIVCYVFPRIFKQFYDKNNWTVWKHILNLFLVLCVIGLGNTLFEWFVLNRSSRAFFDILLLYMLATLLVGIVPVIVITFIIQNSALKQSLKEVEEINKVLSFQNTGITESDQMHAITFASNTKEHITLNADDIIYIESSGNYVNITYQQSKGIKSKLLRMTIKQVEEILQSHNMFIRCHRAYIIHKWKVKQVNGNSQAYRLSLYNTDTEIPVSRSYLKVLKEHLILT